MTDEAKTALDAEIAEDTAKVDKWEEADRLATGFAEMDAEAQTIYDADLLSFYKKVYEDCEKIESKSIWCAIAFDIRDAMTLARANDGFYELATNDREAWDKAYVTTMDTMVREATLATLEQN